MGTRRRRWGLGFCFSILFPAWEEDGKTESMTGKQWMIRAGGEAGARRKTRGCGQEEEMVARRMGDLEILVPGGKRVPEGGEGGVLVGGT